MQVPEAAVHEDYRPVSGQDDVGRPRQIAAVKAVPVAKGMDHAADGQFRRRVLALHAGHAKGALFWRKCVHLPILGRALPYRPDHGHVCQRA